MSLNSKWESNRTNPRYQTIWKPARQEDQGDFCEAVEDLRNEVDELVIKNKTLDQKLQDRDFELEKLNSKLKRYLEQLNFKDIQIQDLYDCQKKLKEEIACFQRTNQEAGDSNSSKNEKDDLICKLKNTIVNLELQVQEMEETISCWEEENELRNQDLEANKHYLEKTFARMDDVCCKIKQYKIELKKLETENAELRACMNDMQSQQTQMKTCYTELKEKCETMEKEKENLEIENLALQRNLDQLHIQYNHCRKCMTRMKEKFECRDQYIGPSVTTESYTDSTVTKVNSQPEKRNDEKASERNKRVVQKKQKSTQWKSNPKLGKRKSSIKRPLNRSRSRCTKKTNEKLHERKTVVFKIYPPSGSDNLKRYRRGNLGVVCKKGASHNRKLSKPKKSMKMLYQKR